LAYRWSMKLGLRAATSDKTCLFQPVTKAVKGLDLFAGCPGAQTADHRPLLRARRAGPKEARGA
jgi:hypothetical protein